MRGTLTLIAALALAAPVLGQTPPAQGDHGTDGGDSCPGMGHMMDDDMGMGGMMMDDEDGCPMRGLADVTVENTKDGAVLRLSARTAADVPAVQRMARHMSDCMTGAPPPQGSRQ